MQRKNSLQIGSISSLGEEVKRIFEIINVFAEHFHVHFLFVLVRSWYFDSAQVYGSLVMVQLVCSEILMAISIFYLDFV